ncbi:MAG TPA: M48 family metallopeptidase [bacterium]|jgi:heat shock protein HtpX|nr:M48 family metallopeptidase [bacterium]HOG38310.1 M48 family metallopeptidase [bacterium]HQI03273.1 M48 family metallopeptidase [bacterium]
MNLYNQISSNKKKTVVLIIFFIVFILALGYLFSYLFEWGYSGLILAIIISIAMSMMSYYSGDKVALFASGAKQITKEENPYVYRMVENLSIASGNPMPQVYIMNDESINAFACGRDPKHSSIAVTTGAINKLENEELEGVIAHEMSHIKNYDIRLMTVVIICVGIISLMADFFIRGSFFRGRDNDDNKSGGLLVLVGIILAILSPIFANLIQLAVSRKREYLADASASLLTRYPEGLANALEKIKNDGIGMTKVNTATAHLFISSPFGINKKSFAKLFSTHPPIEDRIKKLREMSV